jgi:Phospholipase_D-nuclease N-terminal
MPLPAVLFALFTVGFWIPCLLDVARTPRSDFHGLSKRMWMLLIVVFWVFGAAAWLLAGRRRAPLIRRDAAWPAGLGQQDALRRHPAGRSLELGCDAVADGTVRESPARSARKTGPDDDPEFLLELARRIRDAREGR